MITKVSTKAIELQYKCEQYEEKLQQAYATIDLLEKRIIGLRTENTKLEFAIQDKKELEEALRFKTIYA